MAGLEELQRRYRTELREADAPATGGASESSDWVPSEALRQMVSFRRRHLRHVPASEVRSLLSSLNGVWRRRSAREIKKVKAGVKDELDRLRRRVKHQTPYREVLQASVISRLHSQLRGNGGEGGGRGTKVKGKGSAVDRHRALLAAAYGDFSASGRGQSRAQSARRSRSRSSRGRSDSLDGAEGLLHSRLLDELEPPASARGRQSLGGRSRSSGRGRQMVQFGRDSGRGVGLGRSASPDRATHLPLGAGEGLAGGNPGYGWAPQWTRNFPAAATGGAGKPPSWSAAREHAALMESSMAAVDELSRKLQEAEDRAGAAEAGQADLMDSTVDADAARRARLLSHQRGVMWLGR